MYMLHSWISDARRLASRGWNEEPFMDDHLTTVVVYGSVTIVELVP